MLNFWRWYDRLHEPWRLGMCVLLCSPLLFLNCEELPKWFRLLGLMMGSLVISRGWSYDIFIHTQYHVQTPVLRASM
jgi:hypothetical protein